jgi:hypothetical protein
MKRREFITLLGGGGRRVAVGGGCAAADDAGDWLPIVSGDSLADDKTDGNPKSIFHP